MCLVFIAFYVNLATQSRMEERVMEAEAVTEVPGVILLNLSSTGKVSDSVVINVAQTHIYPS